MSQQDTSSDIDPFGPWRTFRDATMEAWAKSMAEAVNTEAFAQNLGTYLNTYLATSVPMQKFVEQYMETTLSRLSMPSRDEVLDLARRFTNIEKRLDDLDAKTDTILHNLHTLADRGPAAVDARLSRLGEQIEGLRQAQAVPSDIDDRLLVLDERLDRVLELLQAAPALPAPVAETEAPKSNRRPRTRPANGLAAAEPLVTPDE